MSHTNSTTNYALPQFITTDKPAWLTDINNAFLAIDTGMDAAKDAADNAQSDATQALTDAGNASTAAATADAKGAGAVASIEAAFDATAVYAVGAKVMYNNLLYRCNVAVVTPGPWTGSANWERITVDSLIPETAGDLPVGSDFTDPTSTAYALKDLQDTKLKVATFTANVTTSGTTPIFLGEITISTMSGYDATAWTNRKAVSIRGNASGDARYGVVGTIRTAGGSDLLDIISFSAMTYAVTMYVFYTDT